MVTISKTAEPPVETIASADAIIAAIPFLHAYALSRLRSSDRAQDAVQDTLERAWRARDRFKPGSNLEGWLMRILQNQMIDGYRKGRWSVEDADGAYAARQSTPADQLWRLEYADLLHAMQALSPDMRQALLLTGLGVTHQEAAQSMGIPLGTLKSHIRRGRICIEAAGV